MELLFLDTETGGLNPFEHSILQIGCVDAKGNEFYKNIKHKLYKVTEMAMKINKLDLAELDKNGFTTKETTNTLIQFVKDNFDEKPILVGHNIAFDKYFVRQMFSENGYEMEDYFSHRMIDTMSLLWGLHLKGKVPISACSSKGAFEYFNIKNEKYHDALSDAKATKELLGKILELI